MVELQIMSREQCHELYRGWENDPAVFMDMSLYKPYVYSKADVDQYYESRQEPSRILFAIVADGKVIGELQLKNIDGQRKECTLSIHLQKDSVKEKGYGTQAVTLALDYAFDIMGMKTVRADSVLKNERSQHVLKKAGFRFIKEEGLFRYYRADRQFSA